MHKLVPQLPHMAHFSHLTFEKGKLVTGLPEIVQFTPQAELVEHVNTKLDNWVLIQFLL